MEEKREKDQENDTASAGPSQIGIHMITNRFPVIRKDATKEHGAISYPVTSCERMNVHVGGLIPFAWERPDNGGKSCNLCDISCILMPRFCHSFCEYLLVSAIFLRKFCGDHFSLCRLLLVFTRGNTQGLCRSLGGMSWRSASRVQARFVWIFGQGPAAQGCTI